MKRKTVIIIFSLLLVGMLIITWKVFGPTVSVKEDKYFYINSGETYGEMKNQLVERKIISSPLLFDWVAKAMNFSVAKAGKYEVKDKMSMAQLIRMLKNGRQASVRLVITKLRLKEDFARKLGQVFEFDSASAISFLNNSDSLEQYGLDSNTVMTAVLPDTYSFYWNTDPQRVYQKLFDHWQQFWNEERKKKAAALNLSPIEVSILASIVDEESNKDSEKQKIASVYINRLHKHMNMQACPTVKYALRDFALKRIYEKHLQVQSPYNTYINSGLPPGPICTPQPSTIDIVLNAPQTDYLYFVANSDFSGTHIYTSDYSDHQKYAKLFAEAQNKQEAIRKGNK